MPIRNVKYDKSLMLQRDLPNANFICTDGDGLKFAPSASNEKVKGLAYHTHHPQESNTILWNGVKLDWTRQALNYNLLTKNQSNCCEDGTTNGFWTYQSATISPDSTQYYEGSHSLKVVTSNLVGDEGAGVSGKRVTPGLKYSGKIRVKGTGNVHLTLHAYDSNGNWIRTVADSGSVTLTSNWQTIDVSNKFEQNEAIASILISTWGKQSATFYIDTCQINSGDPLPWVEGLASDFKVRASLLGITDDGEESIIGEQIITTCPTTEINETLSFDLSKSACQTSFTRESGTATSGKIQLNLPKRWKHFQNATLYRNWLQGWAYRKKAIITNNYTEDLIDYGIIDINVSFVAGKMQSDFRDIRIVDSDGITPLPIYVYNVVNSTSCKVGVKIPRIPRGSNKVIYIYYGNPVASSVSNVYNVYYVFDSAADPNLWQVEVPEGATGSLVHTDWWMRLSTNQNRTWVNLLAKSPPQKSSFKIGQGKHIRSQFYSFEDNNCYTKHIGQFPDGWSNGVEYGYSSAWSTHKLRAPDGTTVNGNQYPPEATWCTGDYYITPTFHKSGFRDEWLTQNYPFGKERDIRFCLRVGDDYCATQGIATVNNYVRDWVDPEPTVGAWGVEETTTSIIPDTPNGENTYLLFSAPADWSNDSYAYLVCNEQDNFNITTLTVPLSAQSIVKLGYNGIDKYTALRLKIESECNNDYTFKFNNFEYIYEI